MHYLKLGVSIEEICDHQKNKKLNHMNIEKITAILLLITSTVIAQDNAK